MFMLMLESSAKVACALLKKLAFWQEMSCSVISFAAVIKSADSHRTALDNSRRHVNTFCFHILTIMSKEQGRSNLNSVVGRILEGPELLWLARISEGPELLWLARIKLENPRWAT